MIRLSRAEIRALAIELAPRLAAELRSGQPSAQEIGALVQGDPCDETQMNRGSMDPINTATSGDSMSLLEAEEDGRRFIERIQRGLLPTPQPRARVAKRKASR